jgi:hypothetical protein
MDAAEGAAKDLGRDTEAGGDENDRAPMVDGVGVVTAADLQRDGAGLARRGADRDDEDEGGGEQGADRRDA